MHLKRLLPLLLPLRFCPVQNNVVVPRTEAMKMAAVLATGCAASNMSCVFFPPECVLGYSAKCPPVRANTSGRFYEPLATTGEVVHLELVGPGMYERTKTKAFLKYIADNADIISSGMRSASLNFYAINPGQHFKAYFIHEIKDKYHDGAGSSNSKFGLYTHTATLNWIQYLTTYGECAAGGEGGVTFSMYYSDERRTS